MNFGWKFESNVAVDLWQMDRWIGKQIELKFKSNNDE